MAGGRLTSGARRRRRRLLLAGATLVAFLLALALIGAGVGDRLEEQSIDARFENRGTQAPPQDLLVVGVDARTFSARSEGGIGEQWPFARAQHARVIDNLVKAGAKGIAYDVQFTEPSSVGQEDDERLLEAVFQATEAGVPVTLATTEVNDDGSSNVFGGDDVVRSVGAKAANAVVPSEDGAVVRRVPYEWDDLRSFSVVTAESVTGKRVARDAFEPQDPLIDFHGPPGTLDYLSFADVWADGFDPAKVKDKIVVVGATAPSLQDLQTTSTSGNGKMPGPELQAEAISTILSGFPLSIPPGWVKWALLVLFILIPPLLGVRRLPGWVPVVGGRRMPPLLGFVAAIVVGLLYLVLAQVLFNHDRVVPVAWPLIGLACSAITTLAVLVLLEASDKRRIHDLFARFVPEKVVDQVVANADEELRLGGEQREATVLFSDLRGFTTYSESRPPDAVIEILNDYLGEMTDAILDAGGTLVAYMGDGIMAVFGAPLDQPDHADRALRAGRDMLDRLERFNAREVPKGQAPFRMGIGLNTGPVISGNVGSERRLEYTTIGDTVNTASRIEGMTKEAPYSLLMAESTVERLAERPGDLEFHEELPIRGRSTTVRLWGLVEPASAGAPVAAASAAPGDDAG
ncbi:MAG: adenylate/guanylate cyclase domain-containing protein [Solirubrobacteraceae bacterium]|nr:adenylate/guanylate cyclase domain-containing protein [Solirubrobacteraceae bacterium]